MNTENLSDNIISINDLSFARTFSEDEAINLVPVFLRISRATKKEINQLTSQLEVFKGQPEKRDLFQGKINIATQKWSEKMRRLGAIPAGPFKVKLSLEKGYGDCVWEFPKDQLYKI